MKVLIKKLPGKENKYSINGKLAVIKTKHDGSNPTGFRTVIHYSELLSDIEHKIFHEYLTNGK